jgi:uncharacterized membrane protein
MDRDARKRAHGWTHYAALVLAVLFVALFFGLTVLKHNAFHTRAFDEGKFDQAIWNTLRGRFLSTSLQSYTILGNHFSPFMALLSPAFVVWSDIRALFLIQTAGLAAAGLLLYKIVHLKRPALAPWFLLAFYLNPALHEVALVEFRRVTLAVPFLALALYALFVRKRWLMAIGLACALLCKENIALIVVMMGLHLIVFQSDWRWGVPLVVIGVAWAVVITLWIIPAFMPSEASLYPHLYYLGLSGDSYQEIIQNVLSDPWVFLRRMFDLAGLQAIWRILLPVGLVLPFLAPDWLLIVVPSVLYMLMSTARGMHRLEDWYMAAVLPGLFAAIAVALGRLPERWARWLTVGLLGTTIIGYVLFSHAPLGAKYEPELYQVTAHHRLAARAVDLIPGDAQVATQDPYVPHLSHREQIYLYPWIRIGLENVDYVLLDRHLHPYPLQPHEMQAAIDDMIADTSYVIEWEADGIFLFRRGGEPLPSFDVDAIADGSMRLDRVEIAAGDEDGVFHTVAQEPVRLERGQKVRVSLYWETLAAPNAERTVSIRIADASGALVAIYDNLPGQGKKPTSWWQEGWKIRDVYYLTVSPQAQLGQGSLDVMVYDSFSGETVPFKGGTEILRLCQVIIDD